MAARTNSKMKKAALWIALPLLLTGFCPAQSSQAAGDELLYAGSRTNLPARGAHPQYSKGI